MITFSSFVCHLLLAVFIIPKANSLNTINKLTAHFLKIYDNATPLHRTCTFIATPIMAMLLRLKSKKINLVHFLVASAATKSRGKKATIGFRFDIMASPSRCSPTEEEFYRPVKICKTLACIATSLKS